MAGFLKLHELSELRRVTVCTGDTIHEIRGHTARVARREEVWRELAKEVPRCGKRFLQGFKGGILIWCDIKPHHVCASSVAQW